MGEGDHEVVEGIFTPRTALSLRPRTPPSRRKMRRTTSPLLRNREETLQTIQTIQTLQTLQTLQTVFLCATADAPPPLITSLLIAP